MIYIFNLHKNFTRILLDLTLILLSINVQDIESTEQDVETKSISVNLTVFLLKIFLFEIS